MLQAGPFEKPEWEVEVSYLGRLQRPDNESELDSVCSKVQTMRHQTRPQALLGLQFPYLTPSLRVEAVPTSVTHTDKHKR